MAQQHGLNEGDLQKLMDKISLIEAQDQEQKKDRRQMKRCVIFITIFLCFIFALQVFMMYTVWGSNSIQTPWGSNTIQKLAGGLRKTYPSYFESSKGNALVPLAINSTRNETAKGQKEKLTKISVAIETAKGQKEKLRNLTKRSKQEWSKQEWNNLTKLKVVGHVLGKVKQFEQIEEETKGSPSGSPWSAFKEVLERQEQQVQADLEWFQNAMHPEANASEANASEGSSQKTARSLFDKARPIVGALLRRDSTQLNSLWATALENESNDIQETAESLAEKQYKLLSSEGNKLLSSLSSTSAVQSNTLTPTTPTLTPTTSSSTTTTTTGQSSRAVFYVCFPKHARIEYVKKYEKVFNKVASSQKGTVYPFCYIDTGTNLRDMYGDEYVQQLLQSKQYKTWINKMFRLEQFCDDQDGITFVMERSFKDVAMSNALSTTATGEIPANPSFDFCEVLLTQSPKSFRIGPSKWYRRVLEKGQGVRASLVEDFISDVYSGNLQAARPAKRDL